MKYMFFNFLAPVIHLPVLCLHWSYFYTSSEGRKVCRKVHPGQLSINFNFVKTRLLTTPLKQWQMCVTQIASHNELRKQCEKQEHGIYRSQAENSEIHVLFVCILLIYPFISSVVWLMACSPTISTCWQKEGLQL